MMDKLLTNKAEQLYESLISVAEANPSEQTYKRIALQMFNEGYKQAYEIACKEAEQIYCEHEAEDVVDAEFEAFWKDYDKKVNRAACIKAWKKIPKKDRRYILEYVPLYKQCQPDKRYRKNPATFLRQRAWLDELIPSQYAERFQSSEQRATAAARLAEGLLNFSAEE